MLMLPIFGVVLTIYEIQDGGTTELLLSEQMWVGGINKRHYYRLPYGVVSSYGLDGCVATLELNGVRPNLLEYGDHGVNEGCNGETKSNNVMSMFAGASSSMFAGAGSSMFFTVKLRG